MTKLTKKFQINLAKFELIMNIIGLVLIFVYLGLVISGKFHKDYYAMLLR